MDSNHLKLCRIIELVGVEHVFEPISPLLIGLIG